MALPYRKFTDRLEARRILTPDDTQMLLERYDGDEWRVLLYLTDRSPEIASHLARIWADALGVAYVELSRTLIQTPVVRRVPEDFARQKKILALYHLGGAVTVTAADPTDHRMLLSAERLLGMRVSPVFSLPSEIVAAIERYYTDTRGDAGPDAEPGPQRINQGDILRLLAERRKPA